MKAIQLIFFLIIFQVSCSDRKTKASSNSDIALSKDSSKLAYARRFYDRAAQMSNLLNLDRLDKGVDSVEIRLWEASILIPEKLLTIKFIENKWRVTETYYWTSIDRLDSLKSVSLTPKIKIEKLLDILTSFDIQNFPSQGELEGFQDNVADGVNYVFEIAFKNRYRVFSYHCPDLFEDPGNKKATELLRIFSKHISQLMFCKN